MFSAANSQLSSASSGNSSGIGSSLAQSSPTLSSVSDTFSSIGSCSWTAGPSGEAEDSEWCLEEEEGKPRRGRKRGRRSRNGGRRNQQGVGGAAAGGGGGVRKRKNDREKERVRDVREQYEQLSAALGDLVERGSGHFSKVRTLGTAIHRVEDLLEELGCSVSQPAERICDNILQTAGGRSEVPCEDTHSSPPPNLSCEESMEPELHPYPTTEAPSTSFDTLFPEEMTSGYPSTQEDVLPTYSTTPYFSYSPAAEFPPMLGSSCLFPFPGNSPGPTLAPPSSLHFSPEMVPHQVGGVIPTSTGVMSPMGMSPPPQLPCQCGSDIWLAIGCN